VTFAPAAPYILRMKRLAPALLLLALTAGCGSSHAAQRPTRLTLTAYSGASGVAVFHLDCAPTGGDVVDPAAACAALHEDPKLVTFPRPFTCLSTSWSVTISGRLAGAPVHERFSTCWTPQSRTLAKLGVAPWGQAPGWSSVLQRHLLPQHRRAVEAYTTRTFAPGTLEPGDLITCKILGKELRLPVGPGWMGSSGSTGPYDRGRASAILTDRRRTDGSVTARCGRASS
jgi:hypothetical protein